MLLSFKPFELSFATFFAFELIILELDIDVGHYMRRPFQFLSIRIDPRAYMPYEFVFLGIGFEYDIYNFSKPQWIFFYPFKKSMMEPLYSDRLKKSIR